MPAQKKLRQGPSSALRRRLLLSTALTGIVLAASQPAGAAIITVTNTNDTGAGSLRQAIMNANPGDTINVTSGLSGTITLGSNLPPVNGVTIDLSAGSVSIAGAFGASFTTGNSSLNSLPANTYSGATSLTSGTLSVSGAQGFAAFQSQLQMSTGTTFTAATTPVSGIAQGATFASLSGAGTITLTGGSGNGLDLTGNDQVHTTFSGQITGSGGEFALFGGGGMLTLTGTNNNYTGPTDIFGGVIVGTPASGMPFAATLQAGATNAFSPNSAVVMFGGANNILDLNNFNQTIASLSGSGVVTLGSAMLTLGGDNTNTTFTGGITGTGGIDKVGTGTFTITNSGGAFQATFSGPTLIDGGVLQAGAANSFSPNSPVFMAPGATLDLNNFNQTIAGLSGTGGSVTLGSGTLTDNQTSSASFAGVISGTGGLTINGAGTLTLTGANTYSGPTNIGLNLSTLTTVTGALQAGAANAFSPNSVVVLSSLGTLNLNGFNNTVGGLASNPGAAVTLGGGTLTVNVASASSTDTFAGVISGSGGLTKTGAGTQTLSGANTFSGAIMVNAGTLQAGATNAFSPNSPVSVGSGATLDLHGFSQTIAGLSGSAGSSVTTGGANLIDNQASSTTFGGVISGSGGLVKNGAGTLTLTGANTYSLQTIIGVNLSTLAAVPGGTLQAGATNTFSPNSAVTLSSAGTLDLNGFNQSIAGLAGAGAVTLGSTNSATHQSGQLTVTGNGNFSGVISGDGGTNPGSGGLTLSGTGTLTLSGNNTYTGQTGINGGTTLALTGNGSIASSSGVTLGAGATFDISGVNTGAAIQTLATTTTTAMVNVGGKTLVFGGSTPVFPGQPDPFLGSFTGNGGLVYNGTDAVLLGGNSSGFTGTLLITNGQVAIGNDIVPNAIFGGNVNVTGGTLTGLGRILGNLTIGGTALPVVQPGGSIGTLTVNGNYTQAANGTLAIEVSPTTSSQLAVGGAASLAGTLKLMFDPGVYTANTKYTFLTASSVSGMFTTVTGTAPTTGIGEMLAFNPTTGQLVLTNSSTPTVTIAPTNDTIYTDLTSMLV